MIKDRQGHIVKELEGQNKLLKKSDRGKSHVLISYNRITKGIVLHIYEIFLKSI